MTPIRALVVDDEQHARANVRTLLDAEPRWRVIGECENAAALRDAVAAEIPDVVFLDIRLPGTSGIELARLLHQLEPRPLVVFTTAFESYAVSAFDVQAIDYLLKPFDDQRFQVALRRAEQALASALAPGTAARYAQRLVIRSIGRVQFVDVAQIDWLEASGNYVEIHAGKQTLLHRERLRVLEDQLDPAEFVRIHRSTIVQRAAIKELRPLAGGDYSVMLWCGVPLRLSRTYRAALDVIARDR
ncbi:MAG TPA: LytTR family DNA-binding domain-containing protein [Kofleriaceae bacterium]|jgi:two-component system LytT family response regulator|nr:LytTR family DNA-binding domain-containing protein [Kofleriaceae bacterium]